MTCGFFHSDETSNFSQVFRIGISIATGVIFLKYNTVLWGTFAETEAETEVLYLQAKDCWPHPKQGTGSPSEPPGTDPVDTMVSDF